ncbi:hypothetical protein ACFWOJ_10830 [Streptomyces sp. NPDC058439]|uniref:hypothetical protein n=1 Tax=Streptomyces sp. NPDC058439 TaxID=3346500 RepID=UPI003660D4DC
MKIDAVQVHVLTQQPQFGRGSRRYGPELHRREARYGPEIMCIGDGQGLAAIFERIEA